MYHFLTEAVKNRFILELRRYWMYHPKYKDIVDNIQGKYSFKERPSYGIVLKTSSANQVQLSADNFQGTVMSHVQLAKVENYPGLSVEWVKEDARAIQDNGGTFPSPPGIYFIEMTEDKEFFVDPLIEVVDETATKVDGTTYRIQHAPLNGTVRVYQIPGSLPLIEGINYTLEKDGNGDPTGDIILTDVLKNNQYLSVDYRYPETSTGPWEIRENFAHLKAIPGVVLAFGRRQEKGDRFAVVLHEHRQATALEYGGRWEISLDFDVIARDVHSQHELADQTVMYLWGVARNRLSTEGIEITDVTMGGETEEIFDDNADDYFYNASFSITTQTDWAIHVPLSAVIRRVVPQTREQADAAAAMTDDQLAEASGTLTTLKTLESLGLRSFEDPYFRDRTKTFESIR